MDTNFMNSENSKRFQISVLCEKYEKKQVKKIRKDSSGKDNQKILDHA